MTQKERMLAALAQKTVDRTPVGMLVTAVTLEIEEKAGAFLPEAHSDAGMMAKLTETIYDEFGVENFKLPFDMTIEAELLGCGINLGSKTVLPQVSQRLEMDRSFLEPNRDIKLEGEGRVKVVTDAIRLIRLHRGTDIPICVSVVGPFSMLGMLFGFENLFLAMTDESELLVDLLNFTTDISIRHANIQLKAGADMIQFGEAGASCSMIGPSFYEKFIMPCHKRLVESVEGPSILHICGNNDKNIENLVAVGAAGLSVDEKTDFEALYRASRGKTSIIGCVPSLFYLNGPAEAVRESAQWYVDHGIDILSNGCTLPAFAPTENVIAMTHIQHPASFGQVSEHAEENER